jgi:hypothetical protein
MRKGKLREKTGQWQAFSVGEIFQKKDLLDKKLWTNIYLSM